MAILREPKVREGVLERVWRQRERILSRLKRRQKPVLDQKIDELLKEVEVRRRVVVRFFRGAGRSVGKGVGAFFRGVGRSISSLLGRLWPTPPGALPTRRSLLCPR